MSKILENLGLSAEFVADALGRAALPPAKPQPENPVVVTAAASPARVRAGVFAKRVADLQCLMEGRERITVAELMLATGWKDDLCRRVLAAAKFCKKWDTLTGKGCETEAFYVCGGGEPPENIHVARGDLVRELLTIRGEMTEDELLCASGLSKDMLRRALREVGAELVAAPTSRAVRVFNLPEKALP